MASLCNLSVSDTINGNSRLRMGNGAKRIVSARIEEGHDMHILATIGHLAMTYRAARARNATERAIASLPIEVQKDIGWPDAERSRTIHPIQVGTWAGGR